MTIAVADLAFVLLHRALAASGDAPAQFTASSGSTTSATAAALTDGDDYWTGALVRWDSGANGGLWSAVSGSDQSSTSIDFVAALPHAVEAGDQFTLFLGGLYASDQRALLATVPPLVHVTGFSVVAAAALNGEGTGTLTFDAGSGTLTWAPPGSGAGDPVAVAGLLIGDRIGIYGPGFSGVPFSQYLLVERTAAALPAEDAADDLSIDFTAGAFLGPVTGTQAAAGVILYRPAAVRNFGGDAPVDVAVYCGRPFPSAMGDELAAAIGTGADVLEAAALTQWPGHGWVYNADKGDLRYFVRRSGRTAEVLDPRGGHRGFAAVAWDPGDAILPFPWCDIGLEAPGVGEAFSDPPDPEAAPGGVAFSCPLVEGDALSIGTIAAGSVHVVWLRIEIPPGMPPLEGGRVDVRVVCGVTE